MDLTAKPLTTDLWPALEDLFGRPGASNGCWCMYWRLGPAYHDRPREQDKAALKELASRPDNPPGLLALDGDLAVGWCELAPRAELGWLAHARHLGPADDLPVWSVPCFTCGALIAAAASPACSSTLPSNWPRPMPRRPSRPTGRHRDTVPHHITPIIRSCADLSAGRSGRA